LQADWYTGNCVFEAPGDAKITDLGWSETRITKRADGSVMLHGEIQTPLGPIRKTVRFCGDTPRIDFTVEFQWANWGRGSLRLGHITLLPNVFDADSLTFTTTNGGFATERFSLAGEVVEHGAPVSFLVSATCALGLTEGWLELGDKYRGIRIEVDREQAPLIGLLIHRSAGDQFFCQLELSALELDDTRKPDAYRNNPRRVSFSVVGNIGHLA
jgi:hypothetical protein